MPGTLVHNPQSLQLSHVRTNVETLPVGRQITKTIRIASIEPRSYERGNCQVAIEKALALAKLQLSHVRTNVETVGLNNSGVHVLRASIEPRSYERGNKVAGKLQERFGLASIEPRSYGRGNVQASKQASANGRGSFN